MNPRYKLKIDLNALNHLGLNLYSNVPAVLSELIANAWDADAGKVYLTILKDGGNTRIVVSDDGCGMDDEDLNKKFLTVGYQRRKNQEDDYTPINRRKVMGRKGIGKLSVFSISEHVQVYTKKNLQTIGLELVLKDIKQDIEKNKPHHPKPILEIPDEYQIDSQTGTIIVLSKLKKRIQSTISRNLRKRIARRFNVWSEKFQVYLGDKEVNITERDYFDKLEYAMIYDEYERSHFEHLRENNRLIERGHTLQGEKGYSVRGWIGLVRKSSLLQEGDDNLNKLAILTRGKIASEDILETFRLGGLYTKFVIGELEADFLDLIDKEDIATSSRQDFLRDEERFIALREFVVKELRFLEAERARYKNEEGTTKAQEIPAIKEWFQELRGDARKSAKKLFGKINAIVIDDEHRKTLYHYGVLAFEHLHYKEKLSELDGFDIHQLEATVSLFSALDDIEASWYYQIIRGRLDVIQTLIQQVEGNDYEKVVRDHIASHLWLLDPSWDRATETPSMERAVKDAFSELAKADGSPNAVGGRMDVYYKKSSGKHIIIELKRANVRTDTIALLNQVNKYRNAVKNIARNAGDNAPVEIICLVGKDLKDWDTLENKRESEQTLAPKNIRVVTYRQLIRDAEISYQNYLEKSKQKGRIAQLLDAIAQHTFD